MKDIIKWIRKEFSKIEYTLKFQKNKIKSTLLINELNYS